MNRQQRREAAKRARADAIVRTEREHEERKIEDRISIVMIEQFYTAAALALRDEFGWGQQRIARMWKRMNELMFSIGEEKEAYEQLRQRLQDEVNLSISWTGGGDE